MKAKDLKALLEKCNENDDVWFEDANGNCIEIVDARVSGDHLGVYLTCRQEFPDTWYRNGEEVHWIDGKGVILENVADGADIMVSDEKLFGTIEDQYLYLVFKDGIAEGDGVRMTYPKLADLTDDQIEEINTYTGGRITDSGVVVPYDVAIKFGKVELIGIMDTTNAHNPDLVREINLKWVRFREHFKPILCALYERDIDEITDAYPFHYPDWEEYDEFKHGMNTGEWEDFDKRALADMKEEWDFHAYNYLMHIADDQDLETILKFVRHDVVEK